MNLIEKKMCNALIEDAEASTGAKMLGAGKVTSIFKLLAGGLWVGGNILLYEDSIEFKPNSMNVMAHKGDVSWKVDLRTVTNAFVSFGIGMQIVNMEVNGVIRKFRCYGAKALVEKILHQASLLK